MVGLLDDRMSNLFPETYNCHKLTRSYISESKLSNILSYQ